MNYKYTAGLIALVAFAVGIGKLYSAVDADSLHEAMRLYQEAQDTIPSLGLVSRTKE
jgi:hypothetical protein